MQEKDCGRTAVTFKTFKLFKGSKAVAKGFATDDKTFINWLDGTRPRVVWLHTYEGFKTISEHGCDMKLVWDEE